jgi:two-component system, OmpR family, response regulator CpxR
LGFALNRSLLPRRTGINQYIIIGSVMRPLLIVEDEVTTRNILTELLGKDGREIVTASDGQKALEHLTKVPPPCLILLDLMMPRMNGWEFLRRKAADPLVADIPTIVLSGSGRPAGVMHQLAKPVDVERLMALIDQYC